MVSKFKSLQLCFRFEKLKVEERVMCLTTVDKEITAQILYMVKALLAKQKSSLQILKKQFPWYCMGNFVL